MRVFSQAPPLAQLLLDINSEELRYPEYKMPRELEVTVSEFVSYYKGKRIHQSLDYDVPAD